MRYQLEMGKEVKVLEGGYVFECDINVPSVSSLPGFWIPGQHKVSIIASVHIPTIACRDQETRAI